MPEARVRRDIGKAAVGQRHDAHDGLVRGRKRCPLVPAFVGPAKYRRAGRGGPVRAAREQCPVPAPCDLAEAAARQAGNIRSPDAAQIGGRQDVDGQRVVVSDGKGTAVRRQRHPIGSLPARRLGFCNGPQRGVVEPDKSVERGHREPAGFVETEPINRPRVIRVLANLAPVARSQQPDPVGTGEADRDVPPIRRPGQPVDDLRQAADPPDEPRRGLEHIEAVRLLPRESRPPSGHDISAVGRQRHGLELTLGPAADLRPQHPDQLAGRQHPQPQCLVVRNRSQHPPGGIGRAGADRRRMGAGLQPQHRLRVRLLLSRGGPRRQQPQSGKH